MKKTNINYPHPVLSANNDDYVNSIFDIELIDDVIIEGENAIAKFRYILECDGLVSLISEGKAKVILYLESPIAEYRQTKPFPANSCETEIKIKINDINRTLTVKGFIISTDQINAFSLPEHNKDSFGEIPFKIRKGDILGLATHTYTIPLESYDPLSDRPSIFVIRRQTNNPKEEVNALFSDQKISIYLNDETYSKYQSLYEAPEIRSVLASFFAAPVLVDVLNFMKHMNEEDRAQYESKKWYQVIDHRLKELKIDLRIEESLTKSANMILPHIFKNAIDSLTVLCAELIKGGEKNEG